MKRGIKIFIFGVITFLILILIIYIEFDILYEINQPKNIIYSVNMAGIERTPFNSEICKNCLNGFNCNEAVKVNFYIKSNIIEGLNCRVFYKEDNSEKEEIVPPKSMGSYVAYAGYNSISGFILDLKKDYKMKVCCWNMLSVKEENESMCHEVEARKVCGY